MTVLRVMNSFLIIAGSLAMASSVRGHTMSCQPASAKASALRAQAVDYASDSVSQRLRTNLGLGRPDTSTIAIVVSDSVCEAVTRSVNVKAQNLRKTALIVVKLGAFYAVCEPGQRAAST